MRYTVRYVENGVIYSDAPTNDLSRAIERELVLRKKYGIDQVWIVDKIQEIMVG